MAYVSLRGLAALWRIGFCLSVLDATIVIFYISVRPYLLRNEVGMNGREESRF
jgi:hypothetical protein